MTGQTPPRCTNPRHSDPHEWDAAECPDRPLVRSDVTYVVRVEHEVTARVRSTATILRSDVAEWLECDESDVTEKDVQSYASEYEDERGDPLIDPSMFDLEEIVDWDSPDVTILSTTRESIVPPSFVPLFDLEQA